MNIDVIMPKMGESITEGTILEWKKNVGESIKLDETLFTGRRRYSDGNFPFTGHGKFGELPGLVIKFFLILRIQKDKFECF